MCYVRQFIWCIHVHNATGLNHAGCFFCLCHCPQLAALLIEQIKLGGFLLFEMRASEFGALATIAAGKGVLT